MIEIILLDCIHSNIFYMKRWYEDSVFKNQAKRDKEEKQRFINDNVRSDFHRKFLKKFIYTWSKIYKIVLFFIKQKNIVSIIKWITCNKYFALFLHQTIKIKSSI